MTPQMKNGGSSCVVRAAAPSLNSVCRIVLMYQNLYDAIHAKSGQSGPLKMQCVRTDKETVMGWVKLPLRLSLISIGR